MSKTVDLNLDALERLAKTYTREVDRMEIRPTDVLTLIQRLREAEHELLNQQQLAAAWQQRIAALEEK